MNDWHVACLHRGSDMAIYASVRRASDLTFNIGESYLVYRPSWIERLLGASFSAREDRALRRAFDDAAARNEYEAFVAGGNE